MVQRDPGYEPSAAELDAWAREHVRYEAQMLVAGALEFGRRYERMPRRDGFAEPTIDDALLESVLVHLRLLDEFLAGSPHRDAVTARHWLPNWSSRCLDKPVREMIDAQVAHLSAKRELARDWDVRGYAYACCRELDRFLVAVAIRNPARSTAFAGTHEEVQRGLAALGS